MTIQLAEDRFFAALDAERFSEDTLEAYRRSVSLFNAMLEKEFGITASSPQSKLCTEQFIRFPQWIMSYRWNGKQRYSRSTLGVYASGIRKFLDELEINGIVNPTDRETLRLRKVMAKIWRQPSSAIPKKLKPEDIAKLLVVIREMDKRPKEKARDIALLEFLACTACRSAEASGLKRGQVNLENMSAVVIGKGRGGGKPGIVYFNETTRDAFIEYWRLAGISNPNDPAFSRHDNRAKKKLISITTATTYHVFREAMLVAGIEKYTMSPHFFRHGGITSVWNQTHDLLITQKYARHASPTTTANIYTHIDDEAVQEAARKTFNRRK